MTSHEPTDPDEQPTVIVPKPAPSAPVPESNDQPTTIVPRRTPQPLPAIEIMARDAATLVLDQAHAPTVRVPRDASPVPTAAATRVAPSLQPARTAPKVADTHVTAVSLPQPAPAMPAAAPPIVQMPGPRTGASASPSSARTAGSAEGRSELPEVGELVKDRFELIEELGRGGMGAVFLARDLRKVEALDPEPHLAIKFISGALIGFERAFVALQREAKNAQRLNHPNIVKVFDFDRDGALVFLTMEVVHGEALHKRLREIAAMPLTGAERAHLAHGMLAGMSYAHARDVSHADLKPSNMMVDANGDLKILDFGIARRAEYDAVFDADDLFALTIDYASPEMLERQRPTPADDVYALGCIVYALHAGAHPFNHTRADQARNERRRATRPSTATRVQWRALRRSLAFTRADRFGDASQFLRAYEGRDWRKLGGIAAMVLVVGTLCAWFAADPLQSWTTVARLPVEQRATLERSLRDGSEYLAGGYAEDAVYALVDALTLDPHNGEARQGVKAALSSLRTKMSRSEYRAYLELQRQDARTPAWLRERIDAEIARLPSS